MSPQHRQILLDDLTLASARRMSIHDWSRKLHGMLGLQSADGSDGAAALQQEVANARIPKIQSALGLLAEHVTHAAGPEALAALRSTLRSPSASHRDRLRAASLILTHIIKLVEQAELRYEMKELEKKWDEVKALRTPQPWERA